MAVPGVSGKWGCVGLLANPASHGMREDSSWVGILRVQTGKLWELPMPPKRRSNCNETRIVENFLATAYEWGCFRLGGWLNPIPSE